MTRWVAVVLLAWATSSSATTPIPMLQNGDFEDGVTAWVSYGDPERDSWRLPITTTNPIDGASSVEFRDEPLTITELGQTVAVTAQTDYRADVAFRGNNLTTGQGLVRIDWLGEDLTLLATDHMTLPGGNAAGTERTILRAPSGSRHATVRLVLRMAPSEPRAVLVLDNVRFEPIVSELNAATFAAAAPCLQQFFECRGACDAILLACEAPATTATPTPTVTTTTTRPAHGNGARTAHWWTTFVENRESTP